MELNESKTAEEQRLDTALRRALPPPALPEHFRARLLIRLASTPLDAEITESRRASLEADWQRARRALERESVRLRWQTLLLLVGGAFTAGAVTVAVMPWVAEHYGTQWSRWVPIAVASLGLLASGWGRRPSEID
jgi:hypothetical protein